MEHSTVAPKFPVASKPFRRMGKRPSTMLRPGANIHAKVNTTVGSAENPANTNNKKASNEKATKEIAEFPKTLNTYLGPKGYTIHKHELSTAELDRLKQMLIARPVSSGVSYGPQTENDFPIYRESAKKMYIPRFFGIEHFGPVKEIKIQHGENIAVPFAGTLKPIQEPVVDAYMRAVAADHGGGLLELPCAFGKTVLSLNIISRLGKKTLVIVNKEFLMNQWIERIGQFLPSARVGRIQGTIIDIEGKDIVLGMLQSISMKEYDDAVFSSFGLCIIDEVHHISSEVFSRALFKIVPKYMLGLSATMERKDGTTGVFKLFLGEVAFKGDREEEHNVEVRAIEYKVADAAFNEVEIDFRGNPKYSTMITKLSEYNDRSEFIVRVIRDLVKEQPTAQIMVLAHTRALLAYLHESIQYRKIATVGFYVGGMKESALKETEEKQIVLATYAMAAEALDIKTLSSLILATPKTDIVQSVGRILRVKHKKPIVVDIVDAHDLFQRQWGQRRRFFKKCDYTIKQIDSIKYAGFDNGTDSWRTVYASKKHGVAKCDAKHEESDSNESDSDQDGGQVRGSNKCLIQLAVEE